jgi:hypothetical protein
LASTLAAVPGAVQTVSSLPKRLAEELAYRVEHPLDRGYAHTLRPLPLSRFLRDLRFRVAGITPNTPAAKRVPIDLAFEESSRKTVDRMARGAGLPAAYGSDFSVEYAPDGEVLYAGNYPRVANAEAQRAQFISRQLLPTLWNTLAQPVGLGRETSPAAAKLSRQLMLDMAAGDVKSYRAANPALTTAADTLRSLGSPVGAGITWLLRQNDAYQRPSPIERYREYRPQLAADARRGLVKPSPTLRNFWQLLKQPYFLAAE